MQTVKNILFDLGGVFLDINYQLTEQAFIELGITDFGQRFNQQFSNTLFEDLETGKIEPSTFYEKFRIETGTVLSDKAIETAWNALLLDFPAERLAWLEEIGKKYPVYLYSNTNLIHYQCFIKLFEEKFKGKNFNDYFRKAYYSHELGLRKPYPEAYTKIMELEKLNPAETLFIDDTFKKYYWCKRSRSPNPLASARGAFMGLGAVIVSMDTDKLTTHTHYRTLPYFFKINIILIFSGFWSFFGLLLVLLLLFKSFFCFFLLLLHFAHFIFHL